MTEAGQTDHREAVGAEVAAPEIKAPEIKAPETATPELIDAITQIFALFRVNYHNQYYSAFNDIALLNQAKRLWLGSLHQYPVECLLKAARQIIEQSEYLPTLHKMIEACDQQDSGFGLPSARKAYMEACLASHPKANYAWSHPAVYHAGSETGWYDLENQPEYVSWPNFKRNYEIFRHRAMQGDAMEIEATVAIAEPEKSSLSKSERQQELKNLRDKLDL